ncbi:CRISPR-associated endoribonuclease Cas6 [Pectinatus sottacetonis]|uniref:CRISPR-associated endoribonuclease Cas6 n=1 Tax=Pectinatus sottacetonis TaxID=1002795 RepID=UPI0018C6C7C7|nr:CRISPR-associated endoribonuclease Cas6 [Pectinatus sottacetonis]
MRIQLKFCLKKPQLPIDYRAACVSFMKSALGNYDKRFFDLYYDNGAQIKSYAFSVRIPRPKFETDKIILAGDKIELNWSAADERDAIIFYNAFLERKKKIFELKDDNAMTLEKIVILPEHKITQPQLIIKMLSPFIVRIHNKENNTNRYVKYDDDDFMEQARKTITAQIEMMGLNTSLLTGFTIKPVQARKCVVKTFKHTCDGTIGILQMQGQPELLNILYRAGMGANRSIGFGLFEKIY